MKTNSSKAAECLTNRNAWSPLSKSNHVPDEMYYIVVQNGQETKKTAPTNSENCNLFNNFFSDVFTKDGKINERSVYPKQRLNYLRISEE